MRVRLAVAHVHVERAVDEPSRGLVVQPVDGYRGGVCAEARAGKLVAAGVIYGARQDHRQPGVVPAVEHGGGNLLAGDGRRDRALRRFHLHGAGLDRDALRYRADRQRDVMANVRGHVKLQAGDLIGFESLVADREGVHPGRHAVKQEVAGRVGSGSGIDAGALVKELHGSSGNSRLRGVGQGTFDGAGGLRGQRKAESEKSKRRTDRIHAIPLLPLVTKL